ncbi:MAG: hypothetical protein IJ362_05435 [Oscillospiraceae bacterium]|nr:hypothetical protein [Oscillospiraceae bacterium]
MKKLLCLIIAFVFVLSGCSAPAPSSSLPQDSRSQPQVLQTDRQIFEGDNFTLHKEKGTAFVEDENGNTTDYIFAANYKSGGYRIELYDENNTASGGHMLVHMTDGEITDVLFFTEDNMFDTFGRWNLISADANEKLTVGSLYSQYSGITINYDFMARTVTVYRHRIADMGEGWQPRATRQDGLYTIYSCYPSAALDESSTWIRDNTTGNTTKLAEGSPDVTGFMADGNLYIMTYGDYREMAVDGSVLFALSDNLLAHREDRDNGTLRIVRGVYKDAIHKRYYVMYYDWGSSGNKDYVPGTELLYDTYQLAVLDENGNTQKVIDTRKYVETSKNYSVELSVRSVNEHTVSFYREVYNNLLFEVFVDLDSEKITLLDYRQWE